MSAKEDFLRKIDENRILKDNAVSYARLRIESFTSAFEALYINIENWLRDTPVSVTSTPLKYFDRLIGEQLAGEHGSLASYDTLSVKLQHGQKTASLEPGGASAGSKSSPQAYLFVENPGSSLDPVKFSLTLDIHSRKWTISQEAFYESDYCPEYPHQEELTEETFFRAIAPLA